MKKLLSIFAAITVLLVAAPPASAQVIDCSFFGAFEPLCNLDFTDLPALVSTVITAIFVIAVIVALFYLIYGAVKWIISEGDKGKVQDARNHIIAAIVGLVIVFLSYFILTIVLRIFGIDIGAISLPTLPNLSG